MKLFSAILATLALGLPASAATVDIIASQDADNVVLTGSGSIDLTGSIYGFSFDIPNFATSNANFFIGAPDATDVYLVGSTFGSSLDTFGTSLGANGFDFQAAGDVFGYDQLGGLAVNQGYTSGSDINFVWTISDAQIGDFQFNFGTVAAFGENTVTLNEAVNVVPLPASSLLLLGSLGFFAVGSRRRTRSS